MADTDSGTYFTFLELGCVTVVTSSECWHLSPKPLEKYIQLSEIILTLHSGVMSRQEILFEVVVLMALQLCMHSHLKYNFLTIDRIKVCEEASTTQAVKMCFHWLLAFSS